MDGLYNQRYKYPPEMILSRSFFLRNPEEFYRFYHDKLTLRDVKPNPAHRRLAELEAEGKLRAVVTQNIDGLHQMAAAGRCWSCTVPSPLLLHPVREKLAEETVNDCAGVPKCDCGGIVRPDVVLYEESRNQAVLAEAVEFIRRADVLIVGGTSLAVYPAAGLIDYYRGHKLVLINRSPTPFDGAARLLIAGKIGEVFAQI